MINTNNLEHAKNLIKNNKKPIIVKSQDSEFNRKILEYGKFDVLIDLEYSDKPDSLKQLESGLNHVLAKFAAKNNIMIGFDLNRFSNLRKKEKAIILGRIMQNIKICRKAGAKITIINIKDKKNAKTFLLSLGASTNQLKSLAF